MIGHSAVIIGIYNTVSGGHLQMVCGERQGSKYSLRRGLPTFMLVFSEGVLRTVIFLHKDGDAHFHVDVLRGLS